jgi:membrane protease YdiL (CAAX protease family)
LTKLGWPPDHQLPVQMFENADSWWMRAYLSVFAVCLAPVAEEFIFRGVLYPCAKQVGSSRSLAVVIGLLVALRILFPLHQHLGINWFLAAGISISFGLGALYPLLKQFSTAILSVICVSVLFALIHFDAATLLPLFVLALALTWLYEKTDNLLAPILVHALFNGTNLVMLELMHLNILPDSQ